MQQPKERSCIGIFDSGVGGLTVMRQVMANLPHEDIIYFGDTARLPYGGKSQETITRYSIENAIFLMEKNIKLLIVACSTASAFAIDRLQQIFNIPIIGTIAPGVEQAVKISKTSCLAVLGTRGTIQSGAYQKQILRHTPSAKVISVPCPMLVHVVEEKYANHSISKILVQEYLQPVKESQVDTVILGCTHYPLLSHLIQEEVGRHVTLVDSGEACANSVKEQLAAHGLASKKSSKGHYTYFVSDDPEKFKSIGEPFLGVPIDHVELISTGF